MHLLKSLSAAALAVVTVAAAHPAAAQTSTIALQNGALVNRFGNYNGDPTVLDFTGTQTYGYAFGAHTQQDSAHTNISGAYINGGVLYQLLGTTGAAGETLTLNGNYYASQGTNNRAGVEFTTAAPTTSNELALGSVLASEDLTASITGADQAFAPLTFTTTVANQDIYLIIEGKDTTLGGNYGPQVSYDTLSLTDTPPAAVPEASSSISLGVLLMLALGGFAVARKRSAFLAA